MSVTPQKVLQTIKSPTPRYLCPLDANKYGVEFLKFVVADNDSKTVVYESPSLEGLSLADLPPVENEDQLRSVKYTFPRNFLKFNTVRTALEFKIGPQPLNDFRMIELHYFKNKLVRTYDFSFGFCIPNSVNTWEAIYDLPEYKDDQILEYVKNPYGHKSDSFYFVGQELIMHNKAEYQYV
ncbi:centriole proteome protein [Dunaliella salina]|uniref:Centriole proteome protein n=1 Tax=Dunaliella salina TaxID=3046 RepID=A0ABQ7FY33_DUNSA|nr:centriole proteome protein [Dunaliella salina]|eukprot:KAF5827271.1 centriole proteome protein [Dunaliella salina]